MTDIRVNASRSYTVAIGSGLLAQLGNCVRPFCPGGLCAVVTDDIVDGLYGQAAMDCLRAAGLEPVKFVFPNGERGKSVQNYLALLDLLVRRGFTRADAVVALGGGVAGDLAGFAAATYLRGIALCQVPTTLLAAVDSSVGGKTGIDLAAGKNLVGSFYQPSAVLCDTDTLATLPLPQLRAGFAEVIKYAMLRDAPFFEELQQLGFDFPQEALIARCVAHKRDLVAADEQDHGCRQLLNLGHTVGHAIEQRSGYTICHGEAVAIGMAVITRAAAAEGLCSPDCPQALSRLLRRFGLPERCPYDARELSAAMQADKKRLGDRLTLVLPKAVGQCILYPIPAASLDGFLKAGLL